MPIPSPSFHRSFIPSQQLLLRVYEVPGRELGAGKTTTRKAMPSLRGCYQSTRQPQPLATLLRNPVQPGPDLILLWCSRWARWKGARSDLWADSKVREKASLLLLMSETCLFWEALAVFYFLDLVPFRSSLGFLATVLLKFIACLG